MRYLFFFFIPISSILGQSTTVFYYTGTNDIDLTVKCEDSIRIMNSYYYLDLEQPDKKLDSINIGNEKKVFFVKKQKNSILYSNSLYCYDQISLQKDIPGQSNYNDCNRTLTYIWVSATSKLVDSNAIFRISGTNRECWLLERESHTGEIEGGSISTKEYIYLDKIYLLPLSKTIITFTGKECDFKYLKSVWTIQVYKIE